MTPISVSEPPTMPEFSKAQLQQAVDTYRTQLTLMVQIQTVLVAGNATVIGLGISNRAAGAFLLGCLFPILVAYMGRGVLKLSVPIIYTAVSIEEQFCAANQDAVVRTFLAYSVSSEYVRQLSQIANSGEDWGKRIDRLRNVGLPRLGVTRRVLCLAFSLQICIPFALVFYFGWKWF